MDGQRADEQRWYDDETYGEPSNRYASLNEDRYQEREGFNPYGAEQFDERSEPSQHAGGDRRSRVRRGKRSGLAMPDAPGHYDDRDFVDGEYAGGQYADGQYGNSQFPEPQHQEPAYGEFPDPVADEPARLSARDRQQLRERAAQTGQPLAAALASGPIATPMVPLIGTSASGSPTSGSPTSVNPVSAAPAALQAPTTAIPTGIRSSPTSTYRSRRPGLAVLLTLGGLIAEMILLKVLLGNVIHSGAGAAAATMGALFALAGTPLLIVGLYALATGAATASGPQPGRAWLKTPLAYLPIGLILIVAAGLAV